MLALSLVAALLAVGSPSPVSATGKFRIGDDVSFEDGSPAPGVKADLFQAAGPYSRGPFIASARTGPDGSYGFPVDDGCYIVVFSALVGTSFGSGDAGRAYAQHHVCIDGASDLGIDEVLFRATPPPPPPPPPPPKTEPRIDIEKFVNGDDADNPPGPTVALGSTVRFTYVVENTGDVPLDGIMVTDNVAGMIGCPRTSLGVGESMNCDSTTMIAELGTHTMEACVKGFNDDRRVDDCDPVFWTVPPPPSTEITECTQRRKRGFVVLADKQFPEDGFVAPSSVKSLDGEELIGYAAFGRNPKRGWGLEGDRFKVDKDDGLGAVIITDQRGSYRVECDIKGSPIGLDLDGSGMVERIEGRFEIDLDADGSVDTLDEWFAPTEGILIDTGIAAEPGVLTGAHLFGDMGGTYADGYEKLAGRDGDGDGRVSGQELAGLAIWVDANSNTILDVGELSYLADHGLVALATEHTDLSSSAIRADGTAMVTQDLWFTIVPAGAGTNTASLWILLVFGAGLLGYTVLSARRRRDGLDGELAELLTEARSR